MIRPSSLYRSDSRRQPTLEASANNITEDSIDCGIVALGCCNTPKCQKMGNKKTFTIILILCGLFQGAIESYFRISAKQSALTHNYDPRIIDWLIVASGIFQGIFAVFVAYWGNRFHRTGWLGGLFMIQAFLCILAIIPTLVYHSEENNTIGAIETTTLCIRQRSEDLTASNFQTSSTLIMLFVLQLGIALGTIAFSTLGFSYIDDNVHEHESPGLIASALAAKYWGFQLGSLVSLIVEWTPFGWFLGWIILAPILFFIGFFAAMFPKRFLSTVVRQAANNILENSTNAAHATLSNAKFIADIDFFPSIVRVFSNKIVIINILAAVFVQTGIINFFRHESSYLQSRFYIPTSEADGINNEWTSQIVASLMKPPILSLSILVSGLIIAKVNPSGRKIVMWNILACSIVVSFFIASIFLKCEHSPIAGAERGKIMKPYCAHSCLCSENTPFFPVCPENSIQTFYSPCHAGCGAEIMLNDIRVFGNCSCGVDITLPMVDMIATEGACGMSNCQPYWIAFHGLVIFASALIASTLIGKLIISIRAVLPQDKSLVLSFELVLIGIIVYIPGKLAYRYIADKTCHYFGPDGLECFLHESPLFGNWMNITTAALVFIGVIFEFILLFMIGDLMLYGDEPEDVYRPMEMNTYRSNGESLNPPTDDDTSPNTALLSQIAQNYSPSQSSPSGVTYAQIQRHNAAQNDNLDFRLQTQRSDNGSVSSDYRTVSTGYVNLPPITVKNVSNRPQSPETSF